MSSTELQTILDKFLVKIFLSFCFLLLFVGISLVVLAILEVISK